MVLYLHGEPGSSQSNLAYFTDQDITKHTMVYYDQRGSGKTLLKNKTLKSNATLPVMIEDLHEIVSVY